MALVKCRECGNEMSTTAAACPKCGAVAPKQTSPLTKVIAVLLPVAILLIYFDVGSRKNEASIPAPALVSRPAVPTAHLELYSKTVPSLTIDGKRITPGITHDEFLSRFGFERIGQETKADPMLPGSLLLFARYRGAKQQLLILVRG